MKMKDDRHTFVICTYKDSPYLRDCIESLKSQTIKSNIIISTSTPTDNVYAIADQNGIEMFVHDEGGSIGRDWNKGMQFSNSTYITIAHQDDIYHPKFLETNLFAMNAVSRPILAFTNYDEIDENGELIKRNINLYIKDIMLKPFILFNGSSKVRDCVFSFGTPICCPSVTYNMSILSDFKFSEMVSATVDWEAFYRINKLNGSWAFSNKRMMFHRIHSKTETTAAIFSNERTKEEYEMFKKYWPKHIAKAVSKVYSRAQYSNCRK